MRKTTIFLIILTFLFCCSQRNIKNNNKIIKEENPILEIGSEGDDLSKSSIIYKVISSFYIDVNENIYIGDLYESRIDKFDKKGKRMCSFGGPGQGPGEFELTLPFAVDSQGILYSGYIGKISIFEPNGKFKSNIKFQEKYKNWSIVKIKIDYADNIYILFYIGPYSYEIIKTNKSFDASISIHKDQNRKTDKPINSTLGNFIPDFDFDSKNNIYITDTIDYKIYKYSPHGELIYTFSKKFKKIRFTKKDLTFPTFKGNEVRTLSPSLLSSLYEVHKFMPSIFGINIDNEKIYIWSTKQDKDFKFIIDIYDKEFKYIKSSSYYNYLKQNYAVIKNNKFYILNIQSDNIEYKKQLSRIAFFNAPYKLLVFNVIDDNQ